MKIIRKYYFPNLCISYTMAVICSSIVKVINYKDSGLSSLFLLELAGLLTIIGIVDFLITRINFKNWILPIGISFVVNYCIYLLVAYFFHWFGFRFSNILMFSLMYVAIFILLYYHTSKTMKQDEERINLLLGQKNQNN